MKNPASPAQPRDWTGHAIGSAISAVDKVLVEYIDRPHHLSPYIKLDAIERMLEFRNRLRREWIRNHKRARTLREE